jgi:hypothetical protein
VTSYIPRQLDWTSDFRQALAAEFDVGPATTPISEGDLARQALLVLAEDPDRRKAIETMVAQPPSLQKFDFGAASRSPRRRSQFCRPASSFERDKDGKCSLLVEKKATSDALLKGLVQRLLNYVK